MESVFLLVPLAAVLALGTVAALFWAVRSGQFEDLEGPAHRILMDDDAPPPRAGATRGEEAAVLGSKKASTPHQPPKEDPS